MEVAFNVAAGLDRGLGVVGWGRLVQEPGSDAIKV